MLLSKEAYEKIDKELSKFPSDKRQSATMASLAIAQEEQNWLSIEILEEIANYIGISPIAVQELATFHSMFNNQPIGKHKISICTNLPCALRDSEKTADYLKKKLDLNCYGSTKDGEFTLIESECMGACGDSPVLIVDNKHMYVRMTTDKLDKFIENFRDIKE